MADNIVTYKVQVDVASGKVAIDGLTKGFVNAKTAVDRLGVAMKKAGNETKNMVDKSGLAGAAVVEIGRTISDFNYGVTAMANNISQLATLLTTLVATTGSAKQGWIELKKAFKGPLGIIVVFQVVIAVIERLAMANKKAEQSTNRLNKALAEGKVSLERMKVLAEVVNDTSESLDDQKQALKELKKNGYDPARQSLLEFIEAQSKLVVVNAAIKAIEEALSKMELKRLQIYSKSKKAISELIDLREKGIGTGITEAEISTLSDSLNKLNKEEEDLLAAYNKRIREQLDLTLFFSSTKGLNGAIKVFKQKLLDLTKEQEKFRKESLENDYLNDNQRIDQEERFAERDLQIQKYLYIQKERLRLANYIDDINKRKISEEQKQDLIRSAQSTFNQEIEDAEAKHFDTLYELNRSYANKRRELQIKDSSENITRFADLVRQSTKMQSDYFARTIAGEENRVTEVVKQNKRENQARLQALKLQKSDLEAANKSTLAITQEIANQELKIKQDTADGERDINIARIKDNQEVAKAILSGLTSVTTFIDTEFQRQLDIEQNKTTAINNELRKRLDNENMSKDERKSIQDQIAKNDEALRLKQEKIEKKRFQMNKAANIATATINTYLAATDVLAREKLGVVGKIAAMTLVIGSGLLQVAAIARQQFVSSASTAGGAFSGGGLGTGGGTQPPDFNIVGASPSNQLAAAVQGQFQQPVKAYVVSKDVSTAQEMDRNIIGSASLG